MRISVWLSFMKNSQCVCTDVKKKIHMCPTSLISQVLAFNKTNPDSVNLVCQKGCALMNSVNCLHCIISMFHMKSFSACLLGLLLNSKCRSAGAPLRCNRNGTIMWHILKASPQHGQQMYSSVTWLWALRVPWKTGICWSRILYKNKKNVWDLQVALETNVDDEFLGPLWVTTLAE